MIKKADVEKQVKEMFALGLHLGHKKSRVHPKARPFIHSFVNGTSIIDLSQTAKQLNLAVTYIKEQIANDKIPLVVATKKISAKIVTPMAIENKIPFIANKWMSGLLTNFDSVIKNVKTMLKLQEGQTNGDWSKFVKHEQFKLKKQLLRLKRFYGGIELLTRRPDFLIILDPKHEKNALREAKQLNIPVVAITDTNTDPNLIQYPVIANDDSVACIEYLLRKLLVSKPVEVEKKTETVKIEKKEVKKLDKKVKLKNKS